ncbi:MAG: Mur ligase family protein [Candidatus Komeilibacteria bacterium]|nr:Mur ligase family protein [Candidatus Komeilibacteria bacterium]
MSFNKYQQAVKFLESLLNLPIQDYLLNAKDRSVYLERLRYFLNLLGNPHLGFKYIHITGTSGKGTTVNVIQEILTAAGNKTGAYFSPHPTTSIERIKVNSRYIAPAEFAALMEKIKPALARCAKTSPLGLPSYFETFLALAFLYFKQKKCQYVVLEAGLGGTHDATNVILKPLVTAITNINFDHQEILGKTLKKIAVDKAGIIKKGSAFFTAETRKPLLKLLAKKCATTNTPFTMIKSKDDPNVALATAIARYLKIEERYIEQGIKTAKLPCRFEIMQTEPLVILDGSHNPSKLKFLANRLKTIPGKKNIILGLSGNKDLDNSLKTIVPLADNLLLTRFLMPFRTTADLKHLAVIAKNIKPKLKPQLYLDPYQALEHGLKITKRRDCLIICGSFFLTGELRTHWLTEEQILKKRRSF